MSKDCSITKQNSPSKLLLPWLHEFYVSSNRPLNYLWFAWNSSWFRLLIRPFTLYNWLPIEHARGNYFRTKLHDDTLEDQLESGSNKSNRSDGNGKDLSRLFVDSQMISWNQSFAWWWDRGSVNCCACRSRPSAFQSLRSNRQHDNQF